MNICRWFLAVTLFFLSAYTSLEATIVSQLRLARSFTTQAIKRCTACGITNPSHMECPVLEVKALRDYMEDLDVRSRMEREIGTCTTAEFDKVTLMLKEFAERKKQAAKMVHDCLYQR